MSGSKIKNVDVLVIGAGQAGLAAGYYLKNSKVQFVLADKAEAVGQAWKSRYDSLTLFTPRGFSSLPGMVMPGDGGGYPTKDEAGDYLDQYARKHGLPIELGMEINRLTRTGEGFTAFSAGREYRASSVIVATGPFQTPYIPEAHSTLSNRIYQVHSSAYRNPSQLRPGSVLIVGGGNSGAQIAVELAKERQVYLSAGESMKFMPLEWMGRSVFWWLDKAGLLNLPETSWLGGKLRRRKDPIFGYELRKLLREDIIKLFPKFKQADGERILFEDGSHCQVNNVIWATGFRPDYRWIDIPGAVDPQGMPVHSSGISAVQGLYYVGLPWQSGRGSALLGGVGRGARRVVDRLALQIPS